MGIVPGTEPAPKEEPLLADEPLPPGVVDHTGDIDSLEKRIRERGPEEVEQADEQADAVEDQGTGEGRPGSGADSGQDPTSDEGADAEDPQAQHGKGPGEGSAE